MNENYGLCVRYMNTVLMYPDPLHCYTKYNIVLVTEAWIKVRLFDK